MRFIVNNSLRATAIALSSTLVLAACGGDDSAPSTSVVVAPDRHPSEGSAPDTSAPVPPTPIESVPPVSPAPVSPAPVDPAPTPTLPVTPIIDPSVPITPNPVSPEPITPPAPVVQPKLTLTDLSFAQTHVVPSGGLHWKLANASAALKVVGRRDALALVTIAQADVAHPVMVASRDGVKLGTLALQPPSALPQTESRGRTYATDRWSAVVPAAWMTAGTSFTVFADNYSTSDPSHPVFGSDAEMRLTVIPFYLFGANGTNSVPFAESALPDEKTRQELFSKWPFSSVDVRTHSSGHVSLPYLVVEPRSDRSGVPQAAYGITGTDQQKDGYAVMSSVLSLIKSMRHANGESDVNNQYYAPIMALNSTGAFSKLYGGLGGGNAGVGDDYGGIFIHEQGHAFGLPHAADGYAAGTYPYANGSVGGSVWGYDQIRREFLDVLVPTTAAHYLGCSKGHLLDAQQRCYKQDPMQGGSGDQSPGYRFTMFSDYNAGRIQGWLDGRILVDPSSPTGYSKWDAGTQRRVTYKPVTTQKGLWGVDDNLPIARDVPVNTIAVTYSRAGSPGASYIYAPIRHTGNLIRTFDPTSEADRKAITANTGTYPWYCRNGGCDYTLRVTYGDGSTIHRVLKSGFRVFGNASGPEPESVHNPLKSESLKLWAINVPGDKPVSKVELLETPMAWNGLPQNPTVVTSREFSADAI